MSDGVAWVMNPWVIGVGGGIVSGFLVTLITRYLFGRREHREYLQRVATANNEISYAVRPSIAEKRLPTSEILDALLTATAQKYGVKPEDLHNKSSLANELIKEIMDNTFLSSEQKQEFCELVLNLKQRQPGAETEASPKVEVVTVSRADRSDVSTILGITTGLTAALAVVMMYVIDRPELRSATSAESLIMRVFPILIAVTVVPVFMTAVTPILRRLAENSRDERAKTEHAGKTADEKAVEEKKGG